MNGTPFTSGTTVTAEGSYTLNVSANDAAGNQLQAAVSFAIDKTPPYFSNLTPPDGALLATHQVTLTGSTDAVTATVNGVPAVISGLAFTAPVTLVEGSNTITIGGVDAAGNVGSKTITWVSDTTPPAIAITSPPSYSITNQATVSVSGTVADASTTNVTVNGVAAVVSNGIFTATGVSLVEGPNTITAQAIDAAGNSSQTSIQVTLDTQPPVISVIDNGAPLADGSLLSHHPTPVIAASDANLGPVTATLNGAAYTSQTLIPDDGTYDLVVTATDLAGNASQLEVHFTVDTTPPALSDIVPATGAFLRSVTGVVSGSCQDAVTVTVNGIAAVVSGGQFQIPSFDFPNGVVTLTFVATDAAGNSSTVMETVTVDATPPAVAITSPADGSYVNASAVMVSGSAIDTNLTSVTVNGVAAAVASDGSFSAGPITAPDGPLTITATATNAAGLTGQATANITVDTQPPAIAITNAGAPLPDGSLFNQAVTPTIAVSDASPITVTILVNGAPFVSGTPVTGDGTYRIDVAAQDAAGNTTAASVTFTIDTQPPQLTNLSPANGTILNTPTINVSGNCGDAVSVKVNGTSAVVASGSFSLAGIALTEGSNALALTATDAAGNTGTASLTIVLDTIAPVVTITSPMPGSLTKNPAATVSGTAVDAHLATVTVNNVSATVSGSNFSAGITLVEGDNLISVIARDTAGNSGSASETVTLDTTPPTVAITSPANGTIIGVNATAVSGTVSDAHLQGVTVNGIVAAVTSGRFVASGVPLVAGANTLTATATDQVGNASTSAVVVTFDDSAPNVAITSPQDGARLRAQPIGVSGTVSGGTGLVVTVNGQSATVSGTNFSANGIALNEGSNTLTARATNDDNKQGVATIAVTFDDVPPTVTSVSPTDGSVDLPVSTVVRLTFSEPVDPATITAANVSVTQDGAGAIVGQLSVSSTIVTFVPNAALPQLSAFTITATTAVTDLAGNPLASQFQSHFQTGSTNAPAPPLLDALPSLLCAQTINVSGTTGPNLRVTITGGAAVASGAADSAGRFSIAVSLLQNQQNVLAVVATDSQNRSSNPSTVTIQADCVPPTVTDASISGQSLVVTFSKPVDPTTVSIGSSVTLQGGSGELGQSLTLSSAGTVATVVGTTNLSAATFQLTVTVDVKDLAGNAMASPFVKSFSPGGGALLGRIFDDSIGRPLGGAVATALTSSGQGLPDPKPVATSVADGSFSLSTPAGETLIAVTEPGHTAVYRTETVETGASTAMFDARLTPLSQAMAGSDGSVAATDGPLSLALPAGALPAGSGITYANVSPQGLSALLPLGWTAIASADLETTGGPTLSAPATATWTNAYGLSSGATPVLAYFDTSTYRWTDVGSGSVSVDGSTLSAVLPTSGSYALLVADPAPYTPPDPAQNQPLAGVAAPAADPFLTATVTPNPAVVLPQQTDTVTVALTTSAPVPSGYPVRALISETLTTLSGQTIEVPDFSSDFAVQLTSSGAPQVVFRIRPSEEATQVALSVGFENISVQHYPFDLTRGDLLTSAGGTINGPGGFSLTVPPDATTESIPVSIAPIASADLPLPVPAGYHSIAAFDLELGPNKLSLPALARYAVPADPGGDLLWIEASNFGNRVVPRFVARAAYDPASGSVGSVTPDSALAVPGVSESGVYILLGADNPIAYDNGQVLDVDGSPLPGALVSETGTTLSAIADGSGRFAIPFPVSGSSISSIRFDTGNVGGAALPSSADGSVVQVNINLQVTAPYVVALTPDPSQPLSLTATIVATFSEPLNPLSVGASAITVTIGGLPVDGTVQLSPFGTQLSFTPSSALPSNVDLSYRISGSVADVTGYGLVDAATKQPGDYTATFHTVDNSPPSGMNPLAITMGLPTGTPPTSTITGGPGAVCGGCTVAAIDDTTQATATVVASSDGSFAVSLQASTSDFVYIKVTKSNGTSVTINPGPFRDPNGQTAVIGTHAADYVTKDHIRLTIADGTFSAATTVQATPISEAQEPIPTPSDATYVGGLSLDLGGAEAAQPIDIGVPAPSGAQANDQYMVAVPVQSLGSTYYMVMDIARLDGSEITTRPSSPQGAAASELRSMAHPVRLLHFRIRPMDGWTGNAEEDIKLVLPRIRITTPIFVFDMHTVYDFVSGVSNDPLALILADTTPFAWFTPRAYDKRNFYLPVPQGKGYQLSVIDSVTGFLRFQGNFSAPTDPNNITVLPPGAMASTDTEPPRLIGSMPGQPVTFVAAPADPTAPVELLPKVSYTYTGDPQAMALTITGSPGSVAPSTRVTLADNERSLQAPPASAGSDGSFNIAVSGAQGGDDFTFVVGEANAAPNPPIHLAFSKPIDLSFVDQNEVVTGVITLTPEGGGVGTAPIGMHAVADPDGLGITLLLDGDLVRGTQYRLKLASGGLADQVGNAIRSDILLPLDSPAVTDPGNPTIGEDVNDMALAGSLLFAVTQGGNLQLFSAGDPANLQPCGQVQKFSGIPLRGVVYDGYGRVVFTGGGGQEGGFLALAHLDSTTSNPCGFQLDYVDTDPSNAVNPGTQTQVSAALGDDTSSLPEGFPRRVKLLSDDQLVNFNVGQPIVPAPPTGFTVAVQPGTDTQPGTARIGAVIPAPPQPPPGFPTPPIRNHPMKVVNQTTGESAVGYSNDQGQIMGADGAAGVLVRASSGDQIQVSINASLLAVVVNQGFGMALVDVNATDLQASTANPQISDQQGLPIAERLLGEFNGQYSLVGNTFCSDASSQCPPGFQCHGSYEDSSENYCFVPLCVARQQTAGGTPGACLLWMSDLSDLVDLAVVKGKDGQSYVLNAVDHFGLAVWTVDLTDVKHPFHYVSQLAMPDTDPTKPTRSGSQTSTGNQILSMEVGQDLPIKPASQRTYCPSGQIGIPARTPTGQLDPSKPDKASLAFLAGGNCVLIPNPVPPPPPPPPGTPPTPWDPYICNGTTGFTVVDVTDPPNLMAPNIVGRYGTSGQVARFGIDPIHDLLYVADGGNGIDIYDISDPCTNNCPDSLCPGGIASTNDPRMIANFKTNGNANVPILCDPELGLAYGAAQDTSTADVGTLYTLSLFAPPVDFVADTDRNGQWEEVTAAIPLGVPSPDKKTALDNVDPSTGKHDPYPADVVRILARISGKAGKTITVPIESASAGGFDLPKAPTGFPASKNFVVLKRQSDDPSNPGYERYLSPPIVLQSDPRAQSQYHLLDVENASKDASKVGGQPNPNACQNCAPADDYSSELSSLGSGATAGTEAAPATNAVEQAAGERLLVRLAKDSAAESALKSTLGYLRNVPLQQPASEADTVRADWTPGLRQRPAAGDSVASGPAAVILSSGEASMETSDLRLPGRGLDLDVTRFFASQAMALGPLGRNWDSPLFARLRQLPESADGKSGADVDYYDGTGRRDRFKFIHDSSNPHFQAPPGVFSELYRLADGRYFLRGLHKTDSVFDRDGRLLEVSDSVRTQQSGENGEAPDGNRMQLFYDGEGRLVSLVDTLKRQVALEYYAQDDTSAGSYPGLVQRMYDHAGAAEDATRRREVLYKYDADGRLAEVDLPELKATRKIAGQLLGDPSGRRVIHYGYEAVPAAGSGNLRQDLVNGGRLEAVQNLRGQSLVELDYADEFGMGALDSVVARNVFAGGNSIPESIHYTVAGDQSVTAAWTDLRGHDHSFAHDAAGHVVSITLSVNDTGDSHGGLGLTVPGGVLASAPFVATVTPNGDGLPTSVVSPGHVQVNRNFTPVQDSDLDRRMRANTADVSLGDPAAPVTNDHFDYDTLVNRVSSHHDLLGNQTDFRRDNPQRIVTSSTLPPTITADGSTPRPAVTYTPDFKTGQILQSVDTQGVATSYSYFDSGSPAYGFLNLVKSGTISQTTLTYERDERGNAIKVTDANGVSDEFDYDEEDRVIEARLATTPSSTGAPALNILRDFVYDEDGNLVREQWTQAGVGTVSRTHAYDERGRRTSTTEGGISTPPAVTSFQYDSSDNLVKVTHPEQDADVLIYDARNLLVGRQRLGPDGLASALHTFTRDADGHVTDDFDGVNTHTRVIYDGAGRPVKVTTPRGTDIAVTYDAAGQTIAVEAQDNTAGSSTVLKRHEMAYAGTGQVASESDKLIDPQNPGSSVFSTTRYAYDLAGRLTRVTDPNGHFVDYLRDDHGRVTQQIDMLGNKSLFSYDQSDNLLQRIDSDVLPDGAHEADRSFAYAFDALNRLLSQTDPLSHATSFSYDELGHVLSKRDAVGSLWSYGYDDRGRLSTEIDPLGNAGDPNQHRTSYSYNKDGMLYILTDAEGHATTYDRDSIQRLVKTTWPDSKFQAKSWNGDGTVATATDENGSVATFTYDPDDQVSAVTYQRATGVVGVTQESFTYDLLGRLTTASCDAGIGNAPHTTQRSYDSLDRLLSKLEDGRAIAYQYDLAGNRTGETYPSNRIFKRSYDPLNRLSRLEELANPGDTSGRLIRSLAYAGTGRVASDATGSGVTSSYSYDAARRLTGISSVGSGNSTIAQFAYGYTDDNLPSFEQRVHEGGLGDTFTFDPDKRLTLQTLSQANPNGPPDQGTPNRQGFSLGSVHERTQELLTLAGVTTTNTVASNPRYGYPSYGPDTNRSYDPSGSLTTDARGSYQWDAKHRLVEADLNDGTTLKYGYDALNRRIEKSKTLTGNSTSTTFFFDGWNGIEEIRDTAIAKDSILAGGLDTALEYRLFGSTNHDFEIFRDANGSTVSVVADDGTSQSFKYLAFGKPALLSAGDGNYSFDLSAATTSSLWQGLNLDADLGWYYARNRWYDPNTGSFLSADPLGYPDSPNSYAWGVGNDFAHDPLGLDGENDEKDYAEVGATPVVEAHNRAKHALGNFGRAGEAAGNTALDVLPGWSQIMAGGRVAEDLKRGDKKSAGIEFGLQALPFALGGVKYIAGGVIRRGGRLESALANEERLVGGGSFRQAVRDEEKLAIKVDLRVGIKTPYGPAVQSILPEAMDARGPLAGGAPVYRLGTTGKSHAAEAQFWTMEHPDTPGFAQRFGIPPDNVKNADFVEVGVVKPGTPFVTRPAPPVGTNPGGGIEVVVPPGGVEVTSFVDR